MIRQTANKAAVVQEDHFWIDAKVNPPPRGSKLLCINRRQGVAVLSDWREDFGFTHWAALPRFKTDP